VVLACPAEPTTGGVRIDGVGQVFIRVDRDAVVGRLQQPVRRRQG
jgi:hypothetical protein